jgi:hypothetical protein
MIFEGRSLEAGRRSLGDRLSRRLGCTVLVVEIRIAGAFLRHSGITAAELSDISKKFDPFWRCTE